jgi:hypothetical protein
MIDLVDYFLHPLGDGRSHGQNAIVVRDTVAIESLLRLAISRRFIVMSFGYGFR